jgi:hypothetical protein
MHLSGRELLEVGLYVLVALVGGFLLAITLEVVYAAALLTGGSGFTNALSGTLAAGGVIEPVATKLVPALFIAYMARTQVATAAEVLADRWLAAGIGLGLAVGLMEFASRLPLLTSADAGLALASCSLAPALVLHPLMGLFVAAPTFRATARGPARSTRRRAIALLGAGLLAAMIVHVWWNTGGAVTVVGWIHPTCEPGAS